jgi:hypothetical protein
MRNAADAGCVPCGAPVDGHHPTISGVICVTQDSIDVRGAARPALTSLRFVAALLVFVTHAAYASPFANAAVGGGFEAVAHNAG